MQIVVADDSRRPAQLDGVTTVELPFNSGISTGRNEGLKHVTTPYVLLMDDDFVLWRHTRLADAIRELARRDAIDIMGGMLVRLPRHALGPELWDLVALFATEACPVLPVGTKIGPLVVYEKVPNFFIARTDRLRLVPWEPRLKRLEHADFFSRARGVLTTALNREFSALHVPTPYDTHYMSYRLDLGDARKFLQARYGR
jgi:glycosyltransferase involved in cell wall biosynthesis